MITNLGPVADAIQRKFDDLRRKLHTDGNPKELAEELADIVGQTVDLVAVLAILGDHTTLTIPTICVGPIHLTAKETA